MQNEVYCILIIVFRLMMLGCDILDRGVVDCNLCLKIVEQSLLGL